MRKNICCLSETSPDPPPPPTDHPPPHTLTLRRSLELAAIYTNIESAAKIIERWNTETSTFSEATSMFDNNKHEAMSFIGRVNHLQKTMNLLVSDDPNSSMLVRAHKLMVMAMNMLEHEFRHLLSKNRTYLDPESVSTRSSRRSSYSDDDDDSNNVMADLKSIAECMIASGYAKECVTIYKNIRKSIMDEGIHRLGVEKAKKMPWEMIEAKIVSWLKAVKVSMETLFKGDKILCDHVFESSEAIRESSFSEISRDGALLLFGFPESFVSKFGKKNSQPEKIFRLLDMYGAIAGKWQAIETIFAYDSTSVVRSQALKSLVSLSESVRSHLVEFETGIHKDSSKVVVQGGGVHPLTNSVMNHLSLLADYNTVLVDILAGSPPPDISLIPESYLNLSDSDDSQSSELTIRFAWLILVLLCKIDRKANHYKDCSVQYLFLTNNLHHVVSRVVSTNLKQLLGDDWIKKHSGKTKQFANSYKRLAWGPTVASLPRNGTVDMSPEEVKERFEKFNERFESAYGKQTGCVVPDPDLREEIKTSIARKIVPAYREFYNTRRSVVILAGDRDSSSVVRFTPEKIENYLADLFLQEGSSGNSSVSSPSACLVGQGSPHPK